MIKMLIKIKSFRKKRADQNKGLIKKKCTESLRKGIRAKKRRRSENGDG